jgi:hypothetical protein
MQQLWHGVAVAVVFLAAVPGWTQAPATPTSPPQPSAPDGTKPEISFPSAATTSQPNTAPVADASSPASPAIDARPTARQHKRAVRHRRPSRAVLAASDEKLLKAKPERSDNAMANAITK